MDSSATVEEIEALAYQARAKHKIYQTAGHWAKSVKTLDVDWEDRLQVAALSIWLVDEHKAGYLTFVHSTERAQLIRDLCHPVAVPYKYWAKPYVADTVEQVTSCELKSWAPPAAEDVQEIRAFIGQLLGDLPERDREILYLLGAGHSTRDVAQRISDQAKYEVTFQQARHLVRKAMEYAREQLAAA